MSIWQQLQTSVQRTTQLVLGLSIVTNIAMLALPLYSLQIFDRVLTSSSIETLWMLLTGVVIIGLTGICFEHLRRKVLTEFSFYMEKSIFPVLIKRINLPTFNQNKHELLEEYNFTVKQIHNASALVFIDALLMPLFIVITYLIHPVLGFFTLIVNTLLILMMVVKYKWQLPIQAKTQSNRSSKQSIMLSNSSALAWLNMTASDDRWFTDKKTEWLSLTNDIKKNDLPVSIISNLNQCIKWLAQVGLPTLGAMLLLSNEITTGAFIAGLIIGGKTFMPVEAMISNLDSFRKMEQFFSKLKLILDVESNKASSYKADLNGKVIIQNLDLDNSRIPDNLFTLSANPGDVVTLVGPSGSGQDTVIRQLMGYQKTEKGEIMFDGIRIEDWDKESLNQSIGFMSGSIQLPEVSIKSLITSFGIVSTTTAIEAAKRSGLNNKLIEWDLSYDTVYKPDTMNASLNQNLKQLISMTTAIALNPQVYILENPETHLDMDSMKTLKRILIEEKARGKTIIMTTHSRSLLQLADKVILLNKGKTLFKGKPDDLDFSKQHGRPVNIPLSDAANQMIMNSKSGAVQ